MNSSAAQITAARSASGAGNDADAQIIRYRVACAYDTDGCRAVQNGGSACSYQELSAPLAFPATAEQTGVPVVGWAERTAS